MCVLYDSVIIGAGAAGISAAINLKIRGKTFIIFGSPENSGAYRAGKIENYPGFESVGGRELTEKLCRHAESLGIVFDRRQVQSAMRLDEDGGKFIVSAQNEMFYSKTLLIATGAPSGKKIIGEEKFLGRGVSYCATCDGRFYRGKKIAVLFDSESFTDDISYLSSLAGRLYLIFSSEYGGKTPDNAEVLQKTGVSEITGDTRVSSLLLSDGKALDVDCLFVLRRSVSAETVMPELITENGFAVTDKSGRTNIDGCFAAGDCTGRPFQYAKAVGEGNVAAHSILSYLG